MLRNHVWLAISLCAVLSFGWAMAQTPASVEASAAKQMAETKPPQSAKQPSAYSNPKVDTSKSDAALDELRYKHLWIAYGLIWLIVFLFMLRTYKVGRENRDTLDTLKNRLLKLEQKDG